MRVLTQSLFIILMLSTVACASKQKQASEKTPAFDVNVSELSSEEAAKLDTVTIAGGCFWCVEAVLERLNGVENVVSGYAGGDQPNPTYQAVSAGMTDYAEVVQVLYNPEVISFQTLLMVFFDSIDPTQVNRQGPDVGKQYRSAIFYHTPEQQQTAENYIKELADSGKYNKEIATKVQSFTKFYVAEDYHQDYYNNNPDNPYIMSVAKPKVKKLIKHFPDLLKEGVS